MYANTYKKSLLSLCAAGALLFSTSAFSFNPPEQEPGGDTANPCKANCGFERGPNPTQALLEAETGPFAVSTQSVGRGNGFGGGTIYYPQGTTGTMGAIAVVPGFVSPESSISWWGPHLASHGFVVITIETNTLLDFPPARADQLTSALDYLVAQSKTAGSPINGMVDRTRTAVVGWSMGGGASLRLATGERVSAAIPLAPWNASNSNQFASIDAPTLIIACESDSVAPVSSHADPFYNLIPASTDKAYVELAGAGHSCANGGGANVALLSTLGVSWMKLHVDKDQRYAPFVCGTDYGSNPIVSDFRSTCPF